jgi:hypothetical protein
VIGDFTVAFVTGKPPLAALEFDRNYIQIAMIMGTARLSINLNAIYVFAMNYEHPFTLLGQQIRCQNQGSDS